MSIYHWKHKVFSAVSFLFLECFTRFFFFLRLRYLVTLVHSLIVSKVDYCNSLFIGLPNVILKKVQSVLNRASRLIFNLPPRVPTTSSLIELH